MARKEEVVAYKPPNLHLTTEELDEMQDLIDKGELPRNAIELQREAEARYVFGHDAKKDRHGNFVEQGVGAKGHESANHFAALRKAEREGSELPGTYRAALAEIWKRDPKRAQKLNLPQPPVEDEPREKRKVA